MTPATVAELLFGLAATEAPDPEVVALEEQREQERQWYGITLEELATAEWVSCTNKVPLTEAELTTIRVAKRGRGSDVLPWPRCPDCKRQMSMSTRPHRDTRPCPECGEGPVGLNVGGTGRDAVLGVWRDAPTDAERFRWYHPGACALKASGSRISSMAVGMPGRGSDSGSFRLPEHPPCARCGQPWSEHFPFGYASRSCTDDPNDTSVYERAPGVIGVAAPAWLVQVTPEEFPAYIAARAEAKREAA